MKVKVEMISWTLCGKHVWEDNLLHNWNDTQNKQTHVVQLKHLHRLYNKFYPNVRDEPNLSYRLFLFTELMRIKLEKSGPNGKCFNTSQGIWPTQLLPHKQFHWIQIRRYSSYINAQWNIVLWKRMVIIRQECIYEFWSIKTERVSRKYHLDEIAKINRAISIYPKSKVLWRVYGDLRNC